MDALGQQIRFSGDVVAARGEEGEEEESKKEVGQAVSPAVFDYAPLPAGETACPTIRNRTSFFHKSCRATATAFAALRRRLSDTAQIQQARGWFLSSVTAPTAIPSCPVTPTMFGGS